jgi:ESCRT-II complex subunit VPS25
MIDALDTPLFYNTELKKRLSLKDARAVIDFMVSAEGDERAEWLSAEKASAWIWWRKPEEWANLIAGWVEDTGQKGVVLTLYEIAEGEATEKQEFHGLDSRILQLSLNTLVKKGKAQVFGTEDQQGVKFF